MPDRTAQAVVFDLDGTLANSELAHERALRTAAETMGMTFSHEYFRERCVGLGERACFRMLAAEHRLELDEAGLAALVEAKLEAFVPAVRAGGVSAYPGAVELLRAVGERAPVAICSGSSQGSVGAMLEALGVAGEVPVVVTSSHVANHKPDPEAYFLAAALLDVRPELCVAIEDSPTGIESAAGAGMRVIALEHSYRAERLAGAHRVVRAIGELRAEEVLDLTAGPG